MASGNGPSLDEAVDAVWVAGNLSAWATADVVVSPDAGAPVDVVVISDAASFVVADS
ncbi:hypothetical protein BVI2075_380003 [Burkholderia vietnamiensis]|nr:hypothetical protein BVI2075_380003 [Burkholderia vietnamiensis]CAG9230495.1 hypothetical protein BVI1335_730020 [Burkholderia vietnamiensis]